MGKLKRRDGAVNLTAMKIDDFNMQTRQRVRMVKHFYCAQFQLKIIEIALISTREEILKDRVTHIGLRVYNIGRGILL